MGPIVLSDEERQIGLPDIDSLFDLYFNKHLAENLMEHVKSEPARCEKIVNKVADAIAENWVKKYQIQSILANHKKNAFTVVWEDGESTVIHLQEGDEWDDEKALAMCFVKKLFGNKGSFNYIFTETLPSKLKVIPKEEKKTTTISVDTPNGTILGTIDCGVSIVTDRIEEVEKKVDNVEKAMDNLKSGVEKASIAAATASDNFSKLVSALTSTPGSTPDPYEDVAKYKVYLYSIFSTDKTLLTEGKKLVELPKFVSAEQKKRITYPGYVRYWSDKTGLYVDYGSHSYYFHIPGLTMEEYNKALNNSN